MKPGKFTYHTPTNLEDAFRLLGEYDGEAKIIAGGQSLIPIMNLRLAQPEHLIDINGIEEISTINIDGDLVRIGALVRHGEIESSDTLKQKLPILPYTATRIAHLAIRNRGTIGGSLCNADPSAEWSLIAILLDAKMEISSMRGNRSVVATDFIQSIYTVDIEPDEILNSITFSLLAHNEGWSVKQICRRAGDFAIVSVAATIALDDKGNIYRLRLCLGGMDSTPIRLTAVEQSAKGMTPDDGWIKDVASEAALAGTPESDMHASAEYRREIAAHLTTEALIEAVNRCKGVGK